VELVEAELEEPSEFVDIIGYRWRRSWQSLHASDSRVGRVCNGRRVGVDGWLGQRGSHTTQSESAWASGKWVVFCSIV
jgi:hypothetical protein